MVISSYHTVSVYHAIYCTIKGVFAKNIIETVCVFPVWGPSAALCGVRFWTGAHRWPPCQPLDSLSAVGRLILSATYIHLHVVHRLRCGALAHGTYLVGPRARRGDPQRRGSRSSPRSRGSRSRFPSSSTAELGSSGSRLGSCTPRPAAQWSRGRRHCGR